MNFIFAFTQTKTPASHNKFSVKLSSLMYNFKIQCIKCSKNKILITYPKQHYYCCGGELFKQNSQLHKNIGALCPCFAIFHNVYYSSQVNTLCIAIFLLFIYQKLIPHCYVLLLYATYCLCTTNLVRQNFTRLSCIYPVNQSLSCTMWIKNVAEETGLCCTSCGTMYIYALILLIYKMRDYEKKRRVSQPGIS